MHDPGSPGIGFVPSQADRSAPVSGAGQLPRYLRGGYRDATPLLTGAARPAPGPRHSAEPAPQRRTLAARYRSADPIDLDGATVYPMYSEQLPTPASALTMTLLSATPPAGLAAVGIGLSVIDGYIDLDDRHLAGVDIWRDALERGITFDLAADSPDALFALTPVWSNAAGEPQSWSGNYGIVVERTETGRTVLWCSMGEGPPHFADLVIEVRSTPLDPHPHLFMSGAIPTVSTATPPERRRNRHHWVEPDDPDSDDLDHDPWAAHYEPASDDSATAPSADESPIEPTAVEPLTTPAVGDSAAAAVTDDSATESTTPESVPAPVVHEPEPTAADSEAETTTSTPTMSMLAVSTPSATAPPATPTVSAHISTDPLPTPTAPTHTTFGVLPALTTAAHNTGGALPELTAPKHTTIDPLPTPTAPEHTTFGLPAVPAVPTLATTSPPAAPAVSTPTTGDFRSAPMPRNALTATTTRNSAATPGTHDSPTTTPDSNHSVTPTVETAEAARRSPAAHIEADWVTTPPAPDSPAESVVGETAWAAGAADSVTESAEDDAEIQGYPCSFADIQLAAPTYAEEPDHIGDMEATAPHRALVDDFTGYDDPLTGTAAGHHFSDEPGPHPDAGRRGWAENPELTGLVPIIRDAGFTDYGPEPPRQATTDSTANTSLYCTPLLSGDEAVTEIAVRDDHSLVDTLADDSLAPVPPADQPYTDEEIDPARLHSLGAVAHAQGDDDRAHLLWTRAARAGHLAAMFDLGALSLQRNDPRAAERWWRAAAGRRMIPAMAELAVLLEQRGAVAEAHMWRTQAVAEEVIATATRRPAAGETLTGTR